MKQIFKHLEVPCNIARRYGTDQLSLNDPLQSPSTAFSPDSALIFHSVAGCRDERRVAVEGLLGGRGREGTGRKQSHHLLVPVMVYDMTVGSHSITDRMSDRAGPPRAETLARGYSGGIAIAAGRLSGRLRGDWVSDPGRGGTGNGGGEARLLLTIAVCDRRSSRAGCCCG